MLKKVMKASAPWCGPCRAYKPIFENVSKMDEFKDIEFEEIDVDEDEGIAYKYGVRGVPATIFIDENEEAIDKLTGIQTETALVDKIKSLM